MNQVKGIIREILSEGHLSVVEIEAAGSLFKAVVIDTPATAPYLKAGNPVNMLFKENEVVMAKSFSGHISIQNRFESTIIALEVGKILCKVTMNYQGFQLVSLITAHAAIQMNLTVGDTVTAMVKTNEISLSPQIDLEPLWITCKLALVTTAILLLISIPLAHGWLIAKTGSNRSLKRW